MNEEEKKMLRWNFDALNFILENSQTANKGSRDELLNDHDRILIDSEVEESEVTLPENLKEVKRALGPVENLNQGKKCIECGQLIRTKKQCSECKDFRLCESKRKEKKE